MSVQLITWAYEQRLGSATQKAVLLALANRANHDTGDCFPSIDKIALEIEVNESTVRRALTALAERGYVCRERQRNANGSLGTYSYSFPKYLAYSLHGRGKTLPCAVPEPTVRSARSNKKNQKLTVTALTNVSADAPNVQELVQAFVDEAREQGTEPPKRIIGHVARELKTLSNEATESELRAALSRLLERGLSPSSLPSVLFDVRQRGSANGTDPLGALLAAHAGQWPTGSRVIRGSHSASYVQDSLGYDKPSHPVTWGRPTRKEILTALRKELA